MPRNSAGTYTLPAAYNPVVTNTTILTAWWNTTGQDMADQITSSLDRSGRGAMLDALKLFDGSLPLPGLSFGSDTTTGFARLASGQMSAIVTGVEVLKLLATGVQFTGTVSAVGAFTIVGTLSVTGALAVTGALTVGGAGSFGGALDMNGFKITELAVPTALTDAASKTYVDSVAISAVLPGQAGNAGKELTTDGSTATWGITAFSALSLLVYLGA